jgi:hypothetical protein
MVRVSGSLSCPSPISPVLPLLFPTPPWDVRLNPESNLNRAYTSTRKSIPQQT